MSGQNENLSGELTLWLEQEKKLGLLFSPASLKTSEFMKEKLKYLDFLSRKYDQQLSPFEKLLKRVMNIERERLEKQLYPYWLQRVARNIFEPRVSPYLLLENSLKGRLETAPSKDYSKTRPEISPRPEQVLKTLAEKPVREQRQGIKTVTQSQIESLMPKKQAGEKNGLKI